MEILNDILAEVKLRREWQVKPNAEQIDGKVFAFRYGWIIEKEESSFYGGEIAYIPTSEDYPKDAPIWIASGDLVRID